MIYIVDEIGKVVESMRPKDQVNAGLPFVPPSYLYDHRGNIQNRLTGMDDSEEQRDYKYPLVFLRMDIPETIKDDIVTYRLNLGILEYTDKDYDVEQRYARVIKPILMPLYLKFIECLKLHKFFWTPFTKFPPHTKYDRPFWGTPGTETNQKRVFKDPLDAIELVDLMISRNIKCK